MQEGELTTHSMLTPDALREGGKQGVARKDRGRRKSLQSGPASAAHGAAEVAGQTSGGGRARCSRSAAQVTVVAVGLFWCESDARAGGDGWGVSGH